MVNCPICTEGYGPLVNDLFTHLKEGHGLEVDWYEISTGKIKLQGRQPSRLEIVAPDKAQETVLKGGKHD